MKAALPTIKAIKQNLANLIILPRRYQKATRVVHINAAIIVGFFVCSTHGSGLKQYLQHQQTQQ